MIEITTEINAIVTCCDESVVRLNFGNGYIVAKAYLEQLSFREKITNGQGQLLSEYLPSAKTDQGGTYLYCISKKEVHGFTPKNEGISEYLERYNLEQRLYLKKIFALLRTFKAGNIGTFVIIFDHRYTQGILTNRIVNNSEPGTRNLVDDRIYSLSDNEINDCNQFVAEYSGDSYVLLKAVIDEFEWGLDQVDVATSFEQLITSLEIALLGHNQTGKKEVLAKRIAVLIEPDAASMKQTYLKMKAFYKYRSESLHEGEENNIDKNDLIQLEEITRRVIKKYLEFARQQLVLNPMLGWDDLKRNMIDEIKDRVTQQDSRAFPSVN